MKIFVSLFLCLLLSGFSPLPTEGKQITASIFPVWLLLRQVTQNVPEISTSILLPASTGCPHDYSMTPQDRKTLARTDILVINGLGLESFLGKGEKLLQLMKSDASVIDIGSRVDALLNDTDHHHSTNPHIFASPSMMARMAESLAVQLSEKDPEHAPLYQANALRIKDSLNTLAEECAALGKKLSGSGIIAQHNVFSYLARDIGLRVDAIIQKHEGQEPSARDLLDLVSLIREKRTAAIITEPQYPARTGKTLSAETAIPCLSLDPAAGGPTDAPMDYYETIMRSNLHTLESALGTR